MYSCCWKVCSRRLASHSGLAAEMRLLRDVNIKPRNLLWQPGLKYLRPFFFFISRADYTHVKWPVPLHLPLGSLIHSFQVIRYQRSYHYICPGCLGEQSRLLPSVFLTLSTAACGWDHCFRHSQRPLLTPASFEVWCELLFTETSQRQVLLTTVHRINTPVCISDISPPTPLPLLLLRLWLQPPRSWNVKNVKSSLIQLLGEVRTPLGDWRGKVCCCSLCTRQLTSALCKDCLCSVSWPHHLHPPPRNLLPISLLMAVNFWMHSYGHPYVIKAFLRREEMSSAEYRL